MRTIDRSSAFKRDYKRESKGQHRLSLDDSLMHVLIALDSGLEVAFSPKLAQGLERAHPADLSEAVISPLGLGIHFPRLD